MKPSSAPNEDSQMDGLIMLAIVAGTLGSFAYVMYLIHKENS